MNPNRAKHTVDALEGGGQPISPSEQLLIQEAHASKDLIRQVELFNLATQEKQSKLRQVACHRITELSRWLFGEGSSYVVSATADGLDTLAFKLDLNCNGSPAMEVFEQLGGLAHEITQMEVPNAYLAYPSFVSFLASAKKCSLLRIVLTDTKVREHGFKVITELPQVKELQLEGASQAHYQHKGVCALLRRCTDLSKLKLARCGTIQLQVLKQFVNKHQGLVELDFRKLVIDDGSLLCLWGAMDGRNIRVLRFSGNESLTGEAFKNFHEHFSGLQELYVDGCPKLDHDRIRSVLKTCERLKTLSALGSIAISTKGCPKRIKVSSSIHPVVE